MERVEYNKSRRYQKWSVAYLHEYYQSSWFDFEDWRLEVEASQNAFPMCLSFCSFCGWVCLCIIILMHCFRFQDSLKHLELRAKPRQNIQIFPLRLSSVCIHLESEKLPSHVKIDPKVPNQINEGVPRGIWNRNTDRYGSGYDTDIQFFKKLGYDILGSVNKKIYTKTYVCKIHEENKHWLLFIIILWEMLTGVFGVFFKKLSFTHM